MGWRNPSGARARTSSASASAHPWAANLGIPDDKTGASLANFPMRAFNRLERVVVLGIQVPDRPAPAAEDHGFRLRPEVVIDHAMQELAVGDTGGRERHILASHQVVDGVDAAQVLEAGGARLLLLVAGAQPEPALQVAAKAFQRAGRQHRLWQATDAEHHIDARALEGGHDG